MNTKNIKDFLQNDLPRLSLIVTGTVLSKDLIQRTVPLNDSVDAEYYRYMQVWNAVCITIANMENTPQHPYKRLIIERYINRKQFKDMGPIIGYKNHATAIKMNEALYSFARGLIGQQIKNNVSPLLEF